MTHLNKDRLLLQTCFSIQYDFNWSGIEYLHYSTRILFFQWQVRSVFSWQTKSALELILALLWKDNLYLLMHMHKLIAHCKLLEGGVGHCTVNLTFESKIENLSVVPCCLAVSISYKQNKKNLRDWSRLTPKIWANVSWMSHSKTNPRMVDKLIT